VGNGHCGPFPWVFGERKFLFVVIDYFIKWVEAKPITTITKEKFIDFL